MRPAIAVFAKAPLPGRVKTRLAAAIGEAEAARRYEEMVAMLLRRLAAEAENLGADIEVHTDISTDAWPDMRVTRRLQVAGDLGERMRHALESGLAEGRTQVLILGGDVPTVPIGHLQWLLTAPEDVALGPAEDGGYYAISCRRTHPAMFAGVAWSTDRACADTESACRAAGLTVAKGPEWFDIDELSDLKRI